MAGTTWVVKMQFICWCFTEVRITTVVVGAGLSGILTVNTA